MGPDILLDTLSILVFPKRQTSVITKEPAMPLDPQPVEAESASGSVLFLDPDLRRKS
jgi:hypothetical protein